LIIRGFRVAIAKVNTENSRALPITPTPAAERQRLSPILTLLLGLMFLSVFINYVDRGNLSIAAPMLKDEFKLSGSQLGILLSSFFWTYAGFQIISGWLVDRFDVKWVMAAGFFLWSGATAVTGVLHGFAILLVARLLLGAGESVAYPSYSKILARDFPEEQRGFANSVIVAGQTGGPGFGMFAGGMLMARFGWRSFFVVIGLVSLLWLWPWLKLMPRGGRMIVNQSAPMPGLGEILQQRSAWGTCGGLFCTNYLSYFLLTWLPFYLVRERHFSMDNMAKIAGSAFLTAALTAMVCGKISDHWIASGGTATRVRKTFTTAGMIVAAVFLFGCVVSGPRLAIFMLVMAAMGFGICCSNLWAITQTLAGPQAAGRWTGVQNFVGNLAGIVAPALTGFVLDRTGEFFWPFVIAAAFCVAGAMCWIFVVGQVRPVQWRIKAEAITA
jgi:ACS family D-galactonate transporter-like MFS transporter